MAPFNLTIITPQLTGAAKKTVDSVAAYKQKAPFIRLVSVSSTEIDALLSDVNRVLGQKGQPLANTKTFIYKGVEIKARA